MRSILDDFMKRLQQFKSPDYHYGLIKSGSKDFRNKDVCTTINQQCSKCSGSGEQECSCGGNPHCQWCNGIGIEPCNHCNGTGFESRN